MPDIFGPEALQKALLDRTSQDPQQEAPKPQGEAKWPYAVLLGGQGADALSTGLSLSKIPGQYETNPLGTGGTLAAKAGYTALMAYLMHHLAKTGHPTGAKVAGIIGGTMGAVPAAMNFKQLVSK